MKLLAQLVKLSNPFVRTELHKWISASMVFSVALVIARIIYTGHLTFIFLVWNLFLAFIPFSISSYLERNPSSIKNRLRLLVALLAWILFIWGVLRRRFGLILHCFFRSHGMG
jgi:hypothetical protein